MTTILACGNTIAEPKKKYVVGVENIEYLPFYDGSMTTMQVYTGFSRALLELFAKQNNIQFEFYTLPIPRLYKEFVEHQRVDFKYPDNPNWQKPYKVKQQVSINYSQDSIVPHTGIASLKENISLSDCKIIGKVRGFTLQGIPSLTNSGNVRIVESESVLDMIYLLYKERINCIYISHNVLTYNIKEFFDVVAPVYFQHHLPIAKQAYKLSSVNYPEVVHKFDIFLKENTEEINALKRKHHIMIE
ncbi:amino acid ABC transporter substrate-binding protein [Pseudoalteromonas agarivorans]|uniref:amino acid ABC transporter substrate-binding protein n=1 Tax=Pseudoalteromonas agarivorans TaxID=176102 RepID=UPI00311E5039